MPTQQEIAGTIQIIKALADTIRELGQVSSGELYARVMGSIDLQTYERIIGILKSGGLVTEQYHILKWEEK